VPLHSHQFIIISFLSSPSHIALLDCSYCRFSIHISALLLL
jgi:hypothetical protein